jgi:hypothetical protein
MDIGMARGRTRLIAGGGLCMCLMFVCISSLAVMFVWSQNQGSDPYKGLPTTPPTLKNLTLQGYVYTLYKQQSNCWAVNYWARVTVTTLIQNLDSALSSSTTPAATKALYAAFLTNYQATLGQLGACPSNAWVIDANGIKQSSTQLAAINARLPAGITKLMTPGAS